MPLSFDPLRELTLWPGPGATDLASGAELPGLPETPILLQGKTAARLHRVREVAEVPLRSADAYCFGSTVVYSICVQMCRDSIMCGTAT